MVSLPSWVSRAVERSATVTRSALGSSRAVSGLRTVARELAIVAGIRDGSYRGHPWVEASAVGGLVSTVGVGLDDAVDHAHFATLGRRWARYVRTSSLFTWLTKEPDPEVIVIDLRDTLTVGPMIALLDATLEFLVPAAERSGLARLVRRGVEVVRATPVRVASLVVLGVTLVSLVVALLSGGLETFETTAGIGMALVAALGTRVRTSWADLVESRPVQLLVAVLEPPPPPEADSDPDTDAGSTESPTGDRHLSERESDD